MKITNDVRSALKNMQYYSNLVRGLAKKQFEEDCKKGDDVGINTEPGSMRFECLGAITGACNYVDLCCINIEANLSSAEKMDEKLFAKEEEASEIQT